jgi:hypothetical protein
MQVLYARAKKLAFLSLGDLLELESDRRSVRGDRSKQSVYGSSHG